MANKLDMIRITVTRAQDTIKKLSKTLQASIADIETIKRDFQRAEQLAANSPGFGNQIENIATTVEQAQQIFQKSNDILAGMSKSFQQATKSIDSFNKQKQKNDHTPKTTVKTIGQDKNV